MGMLFGFDYGAPATLIINNLYLILTILIIIGIICAYWFWKNTKIKDREVLVFVSVFGGIFFVFFFLYNEPIAWLAILLYSMLIQISEVDDWMGAGKCLN